MSDHETDPGLRARATAVGFTAVLLWATLALFTVWSAPVPPLQLNAICFLIGAGIGLLWMLPSGRLKRLGTVPKLPIALMGLGLFAYHALYFAALRNAPPAEAGLIAYLWPMLIIIFSALLPGERLRFGHILGGALGFLGASLLILQGITGISGSVLGYLLALIAAFVWASYSVSSRWFAHVPVEAVMLSCLVSAALSGVMHLGLERTVWPTDTRGWLAVICLGAGPLGLAFYTWDFGMKHGDIQLLGASAYAAPVLSTLILVIAGAAKASPALWIAVGLVVAGAALASWASRTR